MNRYQNVPKSVYQDLYNLVQGKDYFVLTTNVDHCFQKALRADNTFVEDNGWHIAANRYQTFVRRYKDLNIVYLELGVGGNTPGIIRYPFWQMTYKNPNAVYISINLSEAYIPTENKKQSIGIADDIGEALRLLQNCHSLCGYILQTPTSNTRL